MAPLRTFGDRPARTTLAVAVVAAVAVAFAVSPNPRITPDSASYLTGAEQIAEGGRFSSCAGAITLFAPGYSATMASLVAAGFDATDAARVVNVLVTLALVLGAGALARATGLTARASLLVAFSVAVSYATLRDGALVWSEPLFCAILAWLLVLAVNRGHGIMARPSPRIAGVVLLTWALLLTRHSGVFLLPAVLTAAWLGSAAADRRAARLAVFGVALVAVPALWWVRDVHVDGDPFGRRSESRFSLFEILGQLPDGLSSIVVPNAVPLALRLAVVAPLLVAGALAWRKNADDPRRRLAVVVLAAAALTYTAAVTVAAMRTVVDPIDTRLLSPVLVPLAVLVALGVSVPRTPLERRLRTFALLVVAAMTLLAPGIVWRSHDAERTLRTIPEDTSCAEWPARYSGATAVRLVRDRR